MSERDPAEHGKMRKYLSHAFSDRSLSEQEHLISSVIDRYVLKFGKTASSRLDLSKTFEMIAFDIIGSLAFGETFGRSDSGQCVMRYGTMALIMLSFRRAASMDFDSCWCFDAGRPRRCFQTICIPWKNC